MPLSIGAPFTPEFFLDVGAGRLAWARRVLASGVNTDLDTASMPEDVWAGGGLYPFPSAATTLEAVSSSANDTSAGTGMRTMIVQGLDANYAEIQESVTMNGTTPVALANSYLRLNVAAVTSAGSGKTNAGTVTIRETGGGTTRGVMEAGYGNMRQAIYTVPAGYTLMVVSVTLGVVKQASGSAVPHVTGAAYFGSPTGFTRMTQELSTEDTPFLNHIIIPAPVPEKWDFSIRITDCSENNVQISANVLGVLLDNDYL